MWRSLPTGTWCSASPPAAAVSQNFAFHYDEATGAITAEPDYAGVNLVFDLPLDAAKADPTAAQAFLGEWQAKPSSGVSWQDRADTSALHSLMEKYPEAVRAIGKQTNVETAPYRQEAPEGYRDIGPGWYFGDPDDQVYGSYSVGGTWGHSRARRWARRGFPR